MGMFDDKVAREQIAVVSDDVADLVEQVETLTARLNELQAQHDAMRGNIKVLAEASNDHAKRIDAAGSAVVVAADLAAVAAKLQPIGDDVDALRERVFSHIHDFEPNSIEERAGRKRVIYKCRNCPTVSAFVEAG